MVGERKSSKMREQVLQLHKRGIGKRKIATMLGISKNTVKGIVDTATLLRVASVDAFGTSENVPNWSASIDWECVRQEMGGRYVTIKALHADYAPTGVSYLRFWRELQRRFPQSLESQARIRFQYKPGERVEIDYCDGIAFVDSGAGAEIRTYLFCAVSSSSDFTYGEFVLNQKRESFIASQERMFRFFGGVFQYAVIDNLKSGVNTAHVYDPDVNPVYVEYANHMGFAVLPARPVTPRDKPAIETTIGVIQRQFFAEVRNRTFRSLAELNGAFREYLARLNGAIMKDYGVSRQERFREEAPHLKPLPPQTFEISEFKTAKVHPDCHIQVDKNFYSVPYRLIGQEVRVKLTTKLIEAFNSDHESVAIHARKQGCGKFSTIDAHYPEQKIATARFDVLLAKKEAARIGPETAALVNELLDTGQPLRHLRRVQGILRLKKTLSPGAIEYGCHQAMLFNRPRLAYVTDCAKRFELFGLKLRAIGAPERDLSSVYLQTQTQPHKENP